jgi:hypothetical protein
LFVKKEQSLEILNIENQQISVFCLLIYENYYTKLGNENK